jgi:predicted nucleic acid-binding Zn ribbon protein
VSNQAATSKSSGKFCLHCGKAVKHRYPNAIFCSSGCLELFHRDRKSGAVRIERRPERRRPL